MGNGFLMNLQKKVEGIKDKNDFEKAIMEIDPEKEKSVTRVTDKKLTKTQKKMLDGIRKVAEAK